MCLQITYLLLITFPELAAGPRQSTDNQRKSTRSSIKQEVRGNILRSWYFTHSHWTTARPFTANFHNLCDRLTKGTSVFINDFLHEKHGEKKLAGKHKQMIFLDRTKTLFRLIRKAVRLNLTKPNLLGAL